MNERQLNEIISKATYEFTNNGNSDKFKLICYDVMQQCKVSQMITFVQNTPGVDIENFGLVVRTFGSSEENFEYASIAGSNTRLHREAIIALGDIEYNLRAGKQINDDYREEYVNNHGEIVLRGTPYQNFKYLKHNKAKTLNKKPHFDMIIASKNTYINYLCAKEIEGADVLAHGQVIIDSAEIAPNFSFARIPGADVAKHLEVISNYGSAYDNMEVLKTFKCHRTKHVNAIFASKDNEVKLECLRWLEERGLLQKAKKLNLVYDFIEDCKNGYVTIQTPSNSLK